MSWMDSWSRPRKSQPIPPPLYLTQGEDNTPYCHSCGRVISKYIFRHDANGSRCNINSDCPLPTGSRKSEATKDLKTPAKYCSDRCKSRKTNKIDRRIEEIFVALLDGADASALTAHPVNIAADAPIPTAKQDAIRKKKAVKGDPRITVMCEEVETIIFGSRFNPEKTHGRKRNKAKRTLGGDDSEEDTYIDLPSQHSTLSDNSTIFPVTTASTDNSSSDEGSTSDTGGVALPSTTTTPANTDPTAIRTGNHNPPATVLSDHKNFGAGKVRPAQLSAEVNFSVGGERGWAEKLEETPEMLERRREGQRRADEREAVRCAARRLCAFGVPVVGGGKGEVGWDEEEEDGGRKRKGKKGGKKGLDGEDDGVAERGGKAKAKKCEAVLNGAVVEPSFAKGEWGVRWREEF